MTLIDDEFNDHKQQPYRDKLLALQLLALQFKSLPALYISKVSSKLLDKI